MTNFIGKQSVAAAMIIAGSFLALNTALSWGLDSEAWLGIAAAWIMFAIWKLADRGRP